MGQVQIIPNYKPHSKQLLLHNAPSSFDDISITLFGGARGSGKSAGILADAFMFATTYPGAKCAIFREKLDAVKQSFLDKLPTLFPQYIKGKKIYEYKEKSTSWYPSRSIVFENGSYITLQRCADYREALGFRGWEFHYLGVDECTRLEQRALEFLLTCVRSAEILNPYTNKSYKIPTKIVYGCNPGGVSHKYIKESYIDTTVTEYDPVYHTPLKTKDHIIYIPHPIKDGEYIRKYIRFIPASYKDNPYLSASYVANLLAQPEHLKKRDLYGDWDVVSGKMFDLKKEQRIDYNQFCAWVNSPTCRIDIYVSIDWGFKPSYHSALWHAVFEDGSVCTFMQMYGQELVFEDFVKEIDRKSKDLNIDAILLPHDMYRRGDVYRDRGGKIIGETKAEVFENYGFTTLAIESGKGKVAMRYDKIHSAMELKVKEGSPEYKFKITKNCTSIIDELDNAVYDDINVGQIAKSCLDHALDSFGLFLVFYSSDIAPIGIEARQIDTRSKLQRRLEEEDEMLDGEHDEYTIANCF